MEKFTNLVNDVLEGFKSLHVLANQIRIGPRHMRPIEKHGAYNASAILSIAALLTISMGLYSPFATNGVTTGLLSALMSTAIVGIVGTFVNLIEPAANIFTNDESDPSTQAAGIANKWTTYFALNFAVAILLFLIGNGLMAAFERDGRSMVGYMISSGIDYYFSTIIVISATVFISTTLVFYFCRRSGKIVDSMYAVIPIFFWTNIVCASLFYFFQFQLGSFIKSVLYNG